MKNIVIYVTIFVIIYVVFGGLYYAFRFKNENSVSGLYYIDGYEIKHEVNIKKGMLITDGICGSLMLPFALVDKKINGFDIYYTDLKKVRSKR